MIGESFGNYTVVGHLGRGGMGEVYRARDNRLDREVAIKVLPEAFTADADRLARFEREARLLATLNHPNIAAIYGLEESEGRQYLVLELAEGETLAEHIARGPLAVEDALEIAGQLADGLEAAHDKGVVHRDLKPANIKLTPDGKVKILDFGLAKALVGDPSDAATDVSRTSSPTMTHMTGVGMLLGTAGYMSPEQAKAKPVDARTDVWAWGCVLYEMLTGERTFDGETATDMIAAVVTRDPDWDALPAKLPAPVRRLLRRCLARDAGNRLHHIGDARLELRDALSEESDLELLPGAPAATLRGNERSVVGLAALVVIVAIVAAALGGLVVKSLTPDEVAGGAGLRKLSLELEHPFAEGGLIGRLFDFSRDGTQIAYAANVNGTPHLFVRRLDETESRAIPGTGGAGDPYFSPDGRWIAFFASGQLRKVSLSGGRPIALCAAPGVPWGAHWGDNGTIVFATSIGTGLFRVSAEGGTVETIGVDFARGLVRWPHQLPGGLATLVSIHGMHDGVPGPHVGIVDMQTGTLRPLALGSDARYLSNGHILYLSGTTVLAAPFDIARAETTGPAIALSLDVGSWLGAAWIAVADSGDLIHLPHESTPDSRLVWVDRSGALTLAFEEPGRFFAPRLSPDGTRVASMTDISPEGDIYVYDLTRTTRTRLTAEGFDAYPTWHPSGERLVFASDKNPPDFDLYWKPADGSGGEEQITQSPAVEIPQSVSPDGEEILFYNVTSTELQRDVHVLTREGEIVKLVATNYNERAPVFSPDGRWFAYVSDESGRDEVYVRHYPDTGKRWMVSASGGAEPRWAASGELFYRHADAMLAVTITTEPEFRAELPRELFRGAFAIDSFGNANYDVTSDGQRFLMVQGESTGPSRLFVVLNGFAELDRLIDSRDD